jgi:hypothetical protein
MKVKAFLLLIGILGLSLIFFLAVGGAGHSNHSPSNHSPCVGDKAGAAS